MNTLVHKENSRKHKAQRSETQSSELKESKHAVYNEGRCRIVDIQREIENTLIIVRNSKYRAHSDEQELIHSSETKAQLTTKGSKCTDLR